jgi:zinc transport system substrate-binding protein
VRIVLIVVVALLVAGCGGGDSTDGRKRVVAAFYPLAFAAEQIEGSRVHVTNLTPPGVEPHDVELSPRDVKRVAEADLVLYLGGGFQPALEDAIDSTGAKAVDALSGISLHPGEETSSDPHIWLDPVRFQTAVRAIATALGTPERARPLLDRLQLLDADYREGLRSCRRRDLVTSHAAFGYLAERYGLDQVAITGLTPEAEPTPGELRDVVTKVRELGATTVFFETLVSPRLARTVAREVGAKTAVLNPIEGLTPEELRHGDDYFSVMHANLRALRQALGCR